MAARNYVSTALPAVLAADLGASGNPSVISLPGTWPAEFPYPVLIDWGTSSQEAILVTSAPTGTGPYTLPCTRGVDNTTAQAHNAGAQVEHGTTGYEPALLQTVASEVATLSSEIPSLPVSITDGGTGSGTAAQNDVFAGPASGGTGAPSFRALVASDVPTLNQNTTGTAGGLSSTLAIGSGGTNATTAAAARAALSVPQAFSPISYGAVGNGTTDDTTAVQNCFAAAATALGTVSLGYTFKTTSPIPLASNTTVIGSGPTGGKIVNSSSDVFSLTGTVESFSFTNCVITASGGGHIFNCASGASVAQVNFSNCTLNQQNASYCIWYMPSGSYLDVFVGNNTWLNATVGATTSPWYVVTPDNSANSCTFQRLRCTVSARGGTVPFFHIENQASGGYCSDNAFREITGEFLDGGAVSALSMVALTIDNFACYDTVSFNGPVFNIGTGSGSNRSGYIAIRNSGRRGGTLGVPAWAAATAYAVGACVHPVTWSGHIYRCTAAGTSGSSEPSWITTGPPNTQTDGTVTWEDLGSGFSQTVYDVLAASNVVSLVLENVGPESGTGTYSVPVAQTTIIGGGQPATVFPAVSFTGNQSTVEAGCRIIGATASGAPGAGSYAAGDVAVAQNGVIWLYNGSSWVSGGTSLDATASDILAAGNQAAGSNGLGADSGHVHPAPPHLWSPADNGWLIANTALDAALLTTLQTVAGTLYLFKWKITAPVTVSRLVFLIGTGGSGTSTGSYVGLFSSSGTLLTGSADVATYFANPGWTNPPLTTPQPLTAGTYVWAAALLNMPAMPKLNGLDVSVSILNSNLGQSAYRFATNGTGITSPTSMNNGSNITPSSNADTGSPGAALACFCAGY